MLQIKHIFHKILCKQRASTTVLTNDKVTGKGEWAVDSERSTIQAEHSLTPRLAGIVQSKDKTSTETEVRRTAEHYHAVVSLQAQCIVISTTYSSTAWFK